MAKPAKKTESIVKPVVRVAGELHALEKILDGDPDKIPTIKSVGCMRVSPDSNSWISYTILTKGREVISIEVDEPNLRGVAEESAKINFVQQFMDQE